MEAPYFEDIFHYPCSEFKSHLENEYNERILFSGRYGIGKTQFLFDFFKQTTEAEVYDVYHLFPINYSITSNEDILRYLKYDIILELLNKKNEINETQLNFLWTFPKFILNNLHKVAASIVHMVPKVGKDVVETFERIDKLKEEFLKFHEKVNSSEGDKMLEYLQQLELEEGGVYENDIITKLITGLIRKSPKKSVLILDDLDRIDPEHIFRILNVFASHFDRSGIGNKFGFDKIILVCDNKNLKKIFQHKYGIEADYSGYIDKFYSTEVYIFDNSFAIRNILTQIFNAVPFQTSSEQELLAIRRVCFGDSFIINFLTMLLRRGYINLRGILKIYHKKINYHYSEIEVLKYNSAIASWKIPLTVQYRVICDVVGGYSNMSNIFTRCLNAEEEIKDYARYFSNAIFVISMNTLERLFPHRYIFEYRGSSIIMETYNSSISDNIIQARAFSIVPEMTQTKESDNIEYKPTILQFWQSHIEASEKLHRLGYLI